MPSGIIALLAEAEIMKQYTIYYQDLSEKAVKTGDITEYTRCSIVAAAFEKHWLDAEKLIEGDSK